MNMKRLWFFFVLIVWVALLATTSGSQTKPSKAAVIANPELEVPAIAAPRFDRTNRPDPFLNPLTKRKKADVDEELPRGDAPPGIAGMTSNEVELLGLSLSSESKTAAFRGTDKRVYFLHEGDRLFDGYVKTIRVDSVLLIHETKLRSGKVLTQEITKRLRKQ
jgi:hypothetical protein